MNNLAADPEDAGTISGKQDDESTAQYVERMETDENLEKLAGKMHEEWRRDDEAAPDLSFDRFAEKTRKSGRQ